MSLQCSNLTAETHVICGVAGESRLDWEIAVVTSADAHPKGAKLAGLTRRGRETTIMADSSRIVAADRAPSRGSSQGEIEGSSAVSA